MSPEPQSRLDEGTPERLRRQGGDKLIRVLTHSFLNRTPERLAESRQSLESGDIEAVYIMMHNLKSSARLIGALHMGSLCRQAEKLAQEKNATALKTTFEELSAEFEAVRPWIEEMQKEVG